MQKTLLLVLSMYVISQNAKSQITKGNWLVGGNASFISTKSNYQSGGTSKMTYLKLSPNIGYFVVDKFATGFKINIENYKSVIGSSTSSSTGYSFGPFIRYYFLQKDKQINILAEGNYMYDITKPGNLNGNTFSFMAGPVIYFNSSVGLELTVGYATTKSSQNASNNNILLGLGFQIHLEKIK